MSENNILTYPELLKEIEDKDNHLLLANGFNRGLGINTSYPEIFKKMFEGKCGELYKSADSIAKECKYDLEGFIAKLNESIDDNNEFLKKYVSNKVKMDFMEATQQIVKESLKKVYIEQNEGVFVLLNKFTNYFTLNYDSFLYLLLLNFKKIDKETSKELTVGLTPSLKFIEEDLNEKENNIYSEIKNLRENGTLDISFDDNSVSSNLCNITKTHFVTQVEVYAKESDKGWKVKDIEKVAGIIWEEEKDKPILEKVEDGFNQTSLFNVPVHQSDGGIQNVFFLHGAFHIYEDKNKNNAFKITSTQNKALYDRLAEVLNDNELEICTVFQPKNKINAIKESKYLSHCIDRLKSLSGNLVILGSSLDENDNHIFDAINDSKVEKVYISSFKNFEKDMERARNLFPNKEVYLFDAETISYSMN